MSNQYVQAQPATTPVAQLGESERTDTLQAAASRLVKEPEQSAPLEQEPEDSAEPLETEESADETTDDGGDTTSEEGESDEDEGEDEAEGESDEGEEELQYYVVKVDGEEIEVTLDELQSGYQRQKDYTKKTQSLAEQRKVYETKAAEADTLQQQYLQQAQLANELLNRDLVKYQKLDWEDMKVNDPVGYLQKQIEVGEIRQQQAQLQQQAQAAYEHNQKAQAEARNQQLEMERKEALRLFPDWKDSEKAATQKAALVDYGRTIGYSDDELGSIVNARDLVILDKAMKYDAMLNTKKGISKKAAPPAIRKRVKSKGLAPKGANQAKSIGEKRDTLRKSGSVRDAAALMMEMRSSKAIQKPR